MCFLRIGLGMTGYLFPEFLIKEFGADPELNSKMSYIIRVWAIRDIVIGVLVIFSKPRYIIALLIDCFCIDSFDILSAILNHLSTNTSLSDTAGLIFTAVVALIPESLAIFLINKNKTYNKAM